MVDGNAWGTKQIPCFTRPMQIHRLELKLMAWRPQVGQKLLTSSTPPWKWTVAYTPFAKIVVVVHLPCKCQWQDKGLNFSWGLEAIFSFVFNRSCNIQDVANVTYNCWDVLYMEQITLSICSFSTRIEAVLVRRTLGRCSRKLLQNVPHQKGMTTDDPSPDVFHLRRGDGVGAWDRLTGAGPAWFVW